MTEPASPLPVVSADPVQRARALRPLIEAARDELEHQRALPASLVDALVAADLFRLWVPREVGGAEAPLEVLLRAVEEVSQVDAAVGWNLAIGGSGALVSGALGAEALREVFGTPRSVVAGSFNARGSIAGAQVEGGYLLNGQWGFGSGCAQATYFGGVGGVVVDGTLRTLPNGVPEPFMFLFPRSAVQVIDTWKVLGMRGTGSHDYKVEGLKVPPTHAFSLLSPPRQTGPLYRFPLTTLLGLALAPVAVGLGRAAITALVELAGTKRPAGQPNLVRERSLVQSQVARAEGLVRSARALLYDSVGEVWRAVAERGEPVSLEHRALLRLSATHCTHAAAQAVDLMYDAGGASSFHDSSPLQRLFRDAHVATQHAMVATQSYETIGRVFLGMDPGTPRF